MFSHISCVEGKFPLSLQYPFVVSWLIETILVNINQIEKLLQKCTTHKICRLPFCQLFVIINYNK